MNHKRKRAKNQRAGCLMCKPWKVNGAGEENLCESRRTHGDKKRIQSIDDQLEEIMYNMALENMKNASKFRLCDE